jgi:hypothetical protein
VKEMVAQNEDHHFGRPFLSPYQIAIEYASRYPHDYKKTGLAIGGKGIGESNSLAKYIAGKLSRIIKSGELSDIEGGFISNNHLNEISFKNGSIRIKSSLTDTKYDLSIFRLR